MSYIYYFNTITSIYDLTFISSFISPEQPLGAIVSMAFGPFVALGFALAHIPFYILSLIMGKIQFTLFGFFYALFDVFFNFLIAYLSYKLWYGFFRRNNSKDILRLNDIYNLRKFILVSVLVSIVSVLYLYFELMGYCISVDDFFNFF